MNDGVNGFDGVKIFVGVWWINGEFFDSEKITDGEKFDVESGGI